MNLVFNYFLIDNLPSTEYSSLFETKLTCFLNQFLEEQEKTTLSSSRKPTKNGGTCMKRT